MSIQRRSRLWPALVGCLGVAACATAQPANPHVSYYGVIKNAIRLQDSTGRIASGGYGFLAYVFLRDAAQISNAVLHLPGADRAQAFADYRLRPAHERDSYLFILSPEPHIERGSFDGAYPNGAYAVEFATPEGAHRGVVTLEGDDYPEPAVIALFQQDQATAPDSVAPGVPLRVTWGGFPQGRADPNGVLDDLVFVILKDCEGRKLLHSGRPFQGPYLTFRDQSYTFDGTQLEPGTRYSVIVDNARVVSGTAHGGVPGIRSYAQTTRLPIQTTGSNASGHCAR